MLGGVPIIRDLKRCRRSDFSEALKEVFNSFLLALKPNNQSEIFFWQLLILNSFNR
jgi:hypothetical protein